MQSGRREGQAASAHREGMAAPGLWGGGACSRGHADLFHALVRIKLLPTSPGQVAPLAGASSLPWKPVGSIPAQGT